MVVFKTLTVHSLQLRDSKDFLFLEAVVYQQGYLDGSDQSDVRTCVGFQT